MKIKKLLIISMSIIVVFSMLLTACGTQEEPPAAEEPEAGDTTESGEEEAEPEPVEEKVLRMLNPSAPVTLNVHLSPGNKDSEASRLIVEPLAAFDENGEAVPILAKEIPTLENGGISPDLMTTTWNLKEGVKWSDGTDFTADDVVFTWQYIMNPAVGSVSAGSYSAIENVEAVDPLTVKITWMEPNSEPLIAFVALYGPILQKKQFEPFNNEQSSTADANQAPIGTGPFMVVESIPGDTYVYVKNPLYRDAENVYFDRVILKGGGEAATAAQAVVQTGEFDYAFALSLEKEVVEDLNASGEQGQIYSKLTSQTMRFAFNHTNPDPALGDERSQLSHPNPFLSDIRVREALTLTIDRGLIVDQFFGIMAAPTCNVANPPYISMAELKWGDCPTDVERAKSLLDEAGWMDTNGNGIRDKDGIEMEIIFVSGTNQVQQKIQEYAKSAWEEIGIAVEIKVVDPSIMYGDRTNPDYANRFSADVLLMNFGGVGTSTAARYLGNFRCNQIPQIENNWTGFNRERWCNPESGYDELYEEFLAEADPIKHDQLGSQLNDIWVDNYVGIPICQRAIVNAYSNKLKGVRTSSRDLETWNIAEWYMED